MSNPSLTATELAEVVRVLRERWKDSDEAPAVRSACRDLADALHEKDPTFNRWYFWTAAGYVPDREED